MFYKNIKFLSLLTQLSFLFMTEIKNKYTHSEEVANAVSHLVGTIMSIAVCSLFLHKAYQADNALAIVSLWIYFFGVVSSYLASTIYHACPANSENSKSYEMYLKNMCKWAAAKKYCEMNGYKFQILTEETISRLK